MAQAYASGRSRNENRANQLLLAVLVGLIAVIGAMWGHGDIGILQQSMVAGKARSAAQLPTDWPLASAYGDSVVSLLFYAPDQKAFEVRVYENRTGLEGVYFKFGWFPGYDHHFDNADTTAPEYTTVWYAPLTRRDERAYFSMNRAGAVQALTVDGKSYAVLEPDAPFALVGPENLVFLDENGLELPCRMAPQGA